MNTNFYNLWFDSTGNQTGVYRFSSRRSIHLTTDRFLSSGHIDVFLDKTLYDDFFCLVALNKQQVQSALVKHS